MINKLYMGLLQFKWCDKSEKKIKYILIDIIKKSNSQLYWKYSINNIND